MTRAPTSPLSADPVERTRQLVRRSAPNPLRPRLSEDDEQQLAELEARTAACYAAIEDVTDRMEAVAIRCDRITEELSAECVPTIIDDELSAAHSGPVR